MAKYDLVCFDVDGTLVDNVEFSWELFHNAFDVDQVKRKETMKKYFDKEISYLEWAEHDIGMWQAKGVTKQDFHKAMSSLKLMEGAMETIIALKEAGIKLAIVSGSLDIILEYLIPHFNELFDDVYLSRMKFDSSDKLIGADVTEYDMEGKALALKEIAQREGIDLAKTVHIGDHHNDIQIAQTAGLSIAFDCKDEGLLNVADVVIEKKDLRETLSYILA